MTQWRARTLTRTTERACVRGLACTYRLWHIDIGGRGMAGVDRRRTRVPCHEILIKSHTHARTGLVYYHSNQAPAAAAAASHSQRVQPERNYHTIPQHHHQPRGACVRHARYASLEMRATF